MIIEKKTFYPAFMSQNPLSCKNFCSKLELWNFCEQIGRIVISSVFSLFQVFFFLHIKILFLKIHCSVYFLLSSLTNEKVFFVNCEFYYSIKSQNLDILNFDCINPIFFPFILLFCYFAGSWPYQIIHSNFLLIFVFLHFTSTVHL